MADLLIDTDAVRSAGSALNTAGWALTTDTDLVMGACGAPTVSSAADDWAMWAKASLLMLQTGATDAGQSAVEAAGTHETQEKALAAGATTP
ncbi:hypothetical protein [Microbacterium sp.]|uniref:hypothetical protein n=1 Tax=Microbacterium sp. TaxID=51671 RepID=UPI00333F2B7D